MRSGVRWTGTGFLVLTFGCGFSEVRVAEQLGRQGDWDGAVTAYREALKRAPVDFDLQRQLDYAKAQAAEMHFVAGQRVLGEHQIDEAILEFKTALGLNPGAREYHVALSDVLRMKEARDGLQAAHKLRSSGRVEDAMRAYERALELDPDLQEAVEGVGALTAQVRAGKSFGGSNQPITLRFQNAKLKEVFEILTKTSGLSVVFDKEVRDDSITIFIKDMPVDEALNLILNTNGLLAQRVGTDTLLIIPNTKQKLVQYQDLMIRTFYLSNAKAKDAVNLIRTMFESKHVYVDEKINAIVMRDEPAKLHLAERVLQSIDRKDPEVQLDVEVLEVDRTKSLKYGVNFAKAAGAGVFPDAGKGALTTAPTPFTYQQLASIGTGSYLFTIPGSVLLDFFKNDTDAKTLASPKLRVLNNKQARSLSE
jgi:general secretion pathway protein D